MAFKIFFVYHSHIDVGYTERQEKMAVYQADFMRQAVDEALSSRQACRTEKNKFRFTAEGFWAVEQYLKRYGDQGRDRLKAAVEAGHFELTGCYLHMSELLNYQNLYHSVEYVRRFEEDNGFPFTRVAMASDINGFSWGIADALYDTGIRYLMTNINTHHGGAPFGKPLVPFYWESPKGQKLLVWDGLAYHKANLLGLIPGLAPGGDPGIPGMLVEETAFVDVQNTDYAEKRIFAMLDSLRENGYPYDFLPIMGGGLYTDNNPVADDHCELVGEWNRKFGDKVEIITATLQEFFDYLEQNVQDIPTYRGDWNDWWTDGALSTPNETRLFRNAQRTHSLIQKLDPEHKVVSPEELEAIANKLIMYSEHTWGHSNSYWDPCKLLVEQLDARKAKLAFDADVLAGTAYDKLARALGEGEFTCHRPFTYKVINPLDMPKSATVYLPTDFWEEGRFHMGGFQVVDEKGQELFAQKTATLRGSMIACHVELGPHEEKQLEIRFTPSPSQPKLHFLDQEAGKFENDQYIVRYDNRGIYSIVSKAAGEELLDTSAYALGAPVYQIFPGGNRGDAAGFGYSARKKPAMEIHNAVLQAFHVLESGDVFTRLRADFSIKGAQRVMVTYYLYNHTNRLEIQAEMAKDLVLDPEGMYIALPFRAAGGKWYLDKAGAFFEPREHLPKTCCDYFAVQRGVVLSGDHLGISINSLDTLMVTFDRIKLWDFTTDIGEARGPVLSWLCNNKWETNFRNQCAGCLESRYVVEISPALKEAANGPQMLECNEYEPIVLRG